MKILATALIFTLGSATALVEARSETEVLRERCNEQERQIRALEGEIEGLHSQLALERRRARGAMVVEATPKKSPAPKKQTYTVNTGDTLSAIARRYHTTADALMKENGIKDPTRLLVGQKLILPVAAMPSSSVPRPAPPELAAKTKPAPKAVPKPAPKADDHYKVRPGDTLFSVARKHNMSIADLKALNPTLDPDRIIVGQSLGVKGPAKKEPATPAAVAKASPAPKARPAAPAPRPAAAPTPAPAAPSVSSVIVTEEMTFSDFAQKHATTTDKLNALNGHNLRGDVTLARGSEFYVASR